MSSPISASTASSVKESEQEQLILASPPPPPSNYSSPASELVNNNEEAFPLRAYAQEEDLDDPSETETGVSTPVCVIASGKNNLSAGRRVKSAVSHKSEVLEKPPPRRAQSAHHNKVAIVHSPKKEAEQQGARFKSSITENRGAERKSPRSPIPNSIQTDSGDNDEESSVRENTPFPTLEERQQQQQQPRFPRTSFRESYLLATSPPTSATAVESVGSNRSNMADVESRRHWDTDDGVCSSKVKIWTVLAGIVVCLAILISCVASSVHRINEGNVGIYFKHGALMKGVTHPGVHWMAPFVTEVQEISIRPQTDTLRPISSITKDGIQNRFNEVQVISGVNEDALITLIRKFGIDFKEALVFDRIREELRIFCANHTIDEVYNTMFLDIVSVVKRRTESSINRLGQDGIKLLNLVIPKPEIPPDIAANYKQVKVQWTEQLVATQQQKTEEIKKQTESLKAVADAERHKKVLAIELEKQILQKEGEKNLSLLENEIVRKREESNADVANYKKKKAAEANQALYTKEYVQLEMAKQLSNNTKFFFSGEQSVLGGLLNNILN